MTLSSKTLQGHRTKLKRREKQIKGQNRRQSVIAGILCSTVTIAESLSNDDRKSSFQLATERRQRRCIPDRRRQAVSRTCRNHWEGTVTECWTSGWRYQQHGWVSRAQTTSSVDVSYPVQALSKVRRRCSMKTAVGQNAQPECDSLRNSQPMEFTVH